MDIKVVALERLQLDSETEFVERGLPTSLVRGLATEHCWNTGAPRIVKLRGWLVDIWLYIRKRPNGDHHVDVAVIMPTLARRHPPRSKESRSTSAPA
jgi:hypothetical protein